MSFGYVGDLTKINQSKKNQGIIDLDESFDLKASGHLGGSLDLIEEKNVSGSSSTIFENIKENIFSVHFLNIINFQPDTDGTDLRIRLYEGGVEESGSVYDISYLYNTSGTGAGNVQSSSYSYMRSTFNVGNDSYEAGHSYNYFYNLGDSTRYSIQAMHCTVIGNNNQLLTAFGGGVLPQESTVDKIKLYNSGNFSCVAKLYGVKEV